MAGLVMFRRRWGIATDDFVFPGGFEIFLRIVWLFVVLFAYFLEDSGLQTHCGESYGHLEGFLIGSMVLQGMVFITSTLIVIISALGTLSNDRPRRHIAYFLYFRCFLFLPEASLAVYGAYYIGYSEILTLPQCPALIKMVCLFGVLSSITVLFVTFLIIWFIFDPWGASQRMRNKRFADPGLSIEDSKQLKFRQKAEANNVWETRIRTLCCCFVSDTDDNRSALKDVAQLFSEMFEVEINVVPSDVSRMNKVACSWYTVPMVQDRTVGYAIHGRVMWIRASWDQIVIIPIFFPFQKGERLKIVIHLILG